MGFLDKVTGGLQKVGDATAPPQLRGPRVSPTDVVRVELAPGELGPGELVKGRLVADGPVGCKSVALSVRYVDESEEFASGAVEDGPITVQEGPFEGGEEIPFELRLPDPLMPPYKSEVEGIAAERWPRLDVLGRLYWAVWVDIDGVHELDAEKQFEIPVRLSETSGPEPGSRPENYLPEGEGDDWDVRASVDRWWCRRGDEVRVDLEIGEPSGERSGLTVGLVCSALAALTMGDPPSLTVHRHVVWEDTQAVDASVPQQSFRFRVPEDAPFTWGGKSFSHTWRVVVTESRKMRRDLKRETALSVRPGARV